jgi:hypothetical protein
LQNRQFVRNSLFPPKKMTTKLTEMTAEQLRLALVMSAHREIELGRQVIELQKTASDAMRKAVKSMKLAIAAVKTNKTTTPKTNVGNSHWLKSVTGWSIQKISHVCTSQNVPGAFRSGKGRGARWSFRKNLTQGWLDAGCPAKR